MPRSQIERAIWEGDVDLLQELAPCRCCCAEHTFEQSGCRGSDSVDEASWQKFYEQHRGMSSDEFYGGA
jgi:hypothetical protein